MIRLKPCSIKPSTMAKQNNKDPPKRGRRSKTIKWCQETMKNIRGYKKTPKEILDIWEGGRDL